MVIGVGLPASENMIDQAKQFNETIEHFGNDIAVVHIISGLEPKSSDITQMKENQTLLGRYLSTKMVHFPLDYQMESLIL